MGIISHLPMGVQPTGTLSSFSIGSTHTGYLPCDGRTVTESQYPKLFQSNSYGSVIAKEINWTGNLSGTKITVTSSENKNYQHEVPGSIIVGRYQYLMPDIDATDSARYFDRSSGSVSTVSGVTLPGNGTYYLCYSLNQNKMYYINTSEDVVYSCVASTHSGMVSVGSSNGYSFEVGGSVGSKDFFFWYNSSKTYYTTSVTATSSNRVELTNVTSVDYYDPVTQYFYGMNTDSKVVIIKCSSGTPVVTTTSLTSIPSVYNSLFVQNDAVYRISSSGGTTKICNLVDGEAWNDAGASYNPAGSKTIVGDWYFHYGYYNSGESNKYAVAPLAWVDNFKNGTITTVQTTTGSRYGAGVPICHSKLGLQVDSYPYILCWHGYSSSYTYAYYGWKMNLRGATLISRVANLTDTEAGLRAYVKYE